VCYDQPPSDGNIGRPIRRTASELPTGQNIRRPDLADHAATRLAQLSSIGGGATVRLSTVADSDDDDDDDDGENYGVSAAEKKPAPALLVAVEDRPVATRLWAAIDSDRSFLGNGKLFQSLPFNLPLRVCSQTRKSQNVILSALIRSG